ncbi:MAG: hypothetical protein ACF8GE_02250 [Phycisphaerales bacterium JB043]
MRSTIVACAVVLGICVSLQTLTWAFVHFTDVRWKEVEEVVSDEQPVIVSEPGTSSSTRAAGATPGGTAPKAIRTQTVLINRVPSLQNTWFESTVTLVASIGFLAALLMAFRVHQGVVVAGGASVPGVEKVVTASSWAFIIALLCAPIGELVPAFPVHGVFASYESMTAASDLVKAKSPEAPGFFSYYGEFFVIPMLVLAATWFVVVHFLNGIDQGVIATSVSELDEKLEREMSAAKAGGMTSRTAGALNRAIGDRSEPGQDATPLKGIKAPSAGDPLSRPI